MRPIFATGLLMIASCLGCAMCASPHDCKFAAYGGKRERTDMVHGRVGSILDPAPEAMVATAQPMLEKVSPPVDDTEPSTPKRAAENGVDSPVEKPAETSPLDTLPELDDDAIRRELDQLPRDDEPPSLPDETRWQPQRNSESSNVQNPVTRSIIRQMLGELMEDEN